MITRYLLDEHVHPEYRAQLLRREPTLTVFIIGYPGAPAKGTLDPELLRWCEENDSVLVTNNRKSMPGHLKDHLADFPRFVTQNRIAPPTPPSGQSL